MAIGEICNRDVLFARREDTVKTAARLMREFHIGSVVVIDETNGSRQPVGIVTDRDITVAVVALGLDPEVIQVGDIMATELVAAAEDTGVAEAVEIMRLKGIRRLAVRDASGSLVGIVTADDVLVLLAEEMSALASMVEREYKREAGLRKAVI